MEGEFYGDYQRSPESEKSWDESEYNREHVERVTTLLSKCYYSYEYSPEEIDGFLGELQQEKYIVLDAFKHSKYARVLLPNINRLAEMAERAPDPIRPCESATFLESKVSRFAVDLLAELAKGNAIDRAAEEDRVSDDMILKSFSLLVEKGTPGERFGGVLALSSYIPVLEKKLHGDRKTNVPHMAKEYLKMIIVEGDENVRAGALEVLKKEVCTKMDTPEFPAAVAELFEHHNGAEAGFEIIKPVLEQYGLPAEDVMEAWRKSGTIQHSENINTIPFNKIILRNLKTIGEIEAEFPSIAKFLFEKYHIADFGRYPPEMLIAQYKAEGDRTRPYGVVLYPREDHNGAFYGNHKAFTELLKSLDGKFILRIVECASKIDIARALITLDKEYNPQEGGGHPIDLAIIGGHGSENTIRFGGYRFADQPPYILTIDDLGGGGTKRARSFFSSEPTFILNSCSTGVDAGIGRELSERFGAKLVAPKTPTAIRDYHGGKRPDGTWWFNARYHEKGMRAEFKKGHPSRSMRPKPRSGEVQTSM